MQNVKFGCILYSLALIILMVLSLLVVVERKDFCFKLWSLMLLTFKLIVGFEWLFYSLDGYFVDPFNFIFINILTNYTGEEMVVSK